MTGTTYRDEAIAGTMVFTGARSHQGYRINKLAMSLTDPANRDAFRADERGYMAKFGLTEAEMDLVARRDWTGLVEAGGSIYVLLEDRRHRRAEPAADRRADARRDARRLHGGPARQAGHGGREEGLTMARIVGGIGCSHAPSIAHSYDRKLQKDPMWAPLYDGWEPAKEWLTQPQARPDGGRLQRPHEPLLLRRLSELRARRGRQLSAGRRGLGHARLPGLSRPRGVLLASGAEPGRGRVRSDHLPGDERRSRHPVDPAAAHRDALAGADRADRRERDPASDPDAAPLLPARRGDRAARSRAIRRTCACWWSRPAACRISCTDRASASSIRTGTTSSWTGWRAIRSRSPG